MSEEVKPQQGARKRRVYRAAGVVLAGVALASCTGAQKADAFEACEQVALLRGEGSELIDSETSHVSGNAYKVTGTVVTPGLPDEEFTGYADIEDGDYICRMD